MKILPKIERLGDKRTMRDLSNVPEKKKARRKNSALAVQQWKDLKNDKRFALCALAATYEKMGIYLGHHVSAPLHRNGGFEPHAAIPNFAYTFAAAHVSKTDAGKIACYPTLADAKREREIVMSPGRFFAAVYPDASPSVIQSMAEKYACATSPVTVHFGEDEDDFARVYASARGFSSCMAGKWENGEHTNPVRFYAHDDNDLAIAYLTHNNKPNGETVARTIVNTEKKLYVRIYGDARLCTLLEAMGYSHNGQRALSGQKCAARTNEHGDLIAPYLDAVQRIAWDGCSNYCRISSDGDYDATNTGGTAICEDERSECDRCGDRVDEDDMNYSDYHEIHICQSCCDRNYTYAIYNRNGDETYVRDDEIVRVGDSVYLNDDRVLSAHDIVEDEDGDYQQMDDCIYLDYHSAFVLIDNCTRLDFAFGDDEYARDCDLKTVHVDGEAKTVHEDWEDEDEITDEWKAENQEDIDAMKNEDEETARVSTRLETLAARRNRLNALGETWAEDNASEWNQRRIALRNKLNAMIADLESAARAVERLNTLDQTCRLFTAFASFADLLNAVNYRPTVDISEPRLFALANAYDDVQLARGDARRAYRYGNAATIENTEGETV